MDVASPVTTPPVAPSRSRARTMGSLFAGAALMNAAVSATGAAATIVAADHLSPTWGGLPNAASVVGTGLGAFAFTTLARRHGRRTGLVTGYVTAAAGGILSVVAVLLGNVALLCSGGLLLGIGNAGAQLSRYAAAEQYPPDRRGFAIGVLVWAGTVGAVGGPLLLAPTTLLAGHLGWASLAGPFAMAALATALAAVAASRVAGGRPAAAPGRRAGFRELAAIPAARTALAVMTTGQVVMVAVMTAAPLDMHEHGHSMGAVGMVLSAHTFGMFALAPVSGKLLDRFGSRVVMTAGLATLVLTAVLVVANPGGGTALRTVALFLLGYGWNLCFVGGSGHLTGNLPAALRTDLEGAVDTAVWGLAAVAGLGSTVVLAHGGYSVLAVGAAALVLVPAALLVRDRLVRTPAGA